MRIDLHTHSTASDGTDSPAELVVAAAAAGLDVVAITDHDTTAGWADAIAARPAGLTVVPGAEFSCVQYDRDGHRFGLHLLGYLFDPQDAALRAEAQRLRTSRFGRARAMVAKMAADGLPISWARVEALAGGGPVGRPHLARALVDAGAVSTVDEAFAGPVSSRGPYYERKADTDIRAAIGLLRAAGGLPVLAHPIAHRRGPVVSDDTIAALAAVGLVGLEIDHPDHDDADRAHAAALTRDIGLIGLGSSDYHGTNKSRNPLGACLTSSDAYDALLALPSAGRPVGPCGG